MTNVTETVREFSRSGPCIELGEYVKRTAHKIFYKDVWDHGKVKCRSGRTVIGGLVHITPCVSCRDHEHSHYPNGYED